MMFLKLTDQEGGLILVNMSRIAEVYARSEGGSRMFRDIPPHDDLPIGTYLEVNETPDQIMEMMAPVVRDDQEPV